VIGFASQNGGTTGGCGGETVNVSSYDDLANAVSGSDRRIVQISGTISGSGMMDVGSNKTIIGTGSGASVSGFGFNISRQQNVIIQNMSFTQANDDSINVQSESTNIWIDHNTFSNGNDGLVDIKRGSSYITVSWNRFSNHHKTCLLGHSDDNGDQDVGKLKVTYHHNYFDGSNTRHPRARFGHVHVFNNYYRSCSYGVASTCDAMVLVEANYFEDTKSPTLTQYGSSPSGNVAERDNAYVNSGSPETRGSVPGVPYSYSPDNASDIPSIVSNGAGAGRL
jgi:pectate lyase